MPHIEAPVATSVRAMCSHVQSNRYSAVMLVKINRQQRRESGWLLTRERREAAGLDHLPRQKRELCCTGNAGCWGEWSLPARILWEKRSQDVKGTEQNFYLSRVWHSQSLRHNLCALWQFECFPLLLVTKTLATAVCSNWEHTVATPYSGQSYRVSRVHLLLRGMWNTAPWCLYERPRLKEFPHPSLTGSDLRSKK